MVTKNRYYKRSRIAEHPSLKPQSLMRQLVYAALPLGEGVVVDTFMGAGTTLAAAEAVGYKSIGVERYANYYDIALQSAALLSGFPANEGARPLEQAALSL